MTAHRAGRRALAARIYACAHLVGEFTLRSGATSTEYFDKYRFEADPDLLASVAEAMVPLVWEDAEVLAGLELGGVPLATMLASVTGLSARFVRKQPKPYGTRQLAEGGDVAGRRVVVVEDVVTSGGQVVTSCRQLADLGADVLGVVCVIDRQAGGPEALAAEGLELRALYTASDLAAAGSREELRS